MSRYMIENMDKINYFPRYHVKDPLEDNDLSNFRLSKVLLNTFLDKIEDNKRELVLRGNYLILRMGRRLKDSDMPFLMKFLHCNPEVTSLDLAYNEITYAGMYTICEFLQSHDAQLLKLNVMCNDLDWRSIAKLASLGENLSLHSLRVNGNKFGAEGGKALSLLLACHPCLRHLDVGETDQDASSLAYFTAMLRWDRGGNETLEMLDLSRPHGPWNYQFDSPHVAEQMGEMLRYNCVLRELHLQKYGFSDHDIELMMLGLKDNRNLRLLDLSCNNIGCDGAMIIGNYLATRPALLGLMLAHNQIKDTGARSLSFTLPYSRVKLLDLSYNQLTDNGFLDILNSIKKPIILRCLYVWGNKITHKSLLVGRGRDPRKQTMRMKRWSQLRQSRPWTVLAIMEGNESMVLLLLHGTYTSLERHSKQPSACSDKPGPSNTTDPPSKKRLEWTKETVVAIELRERKGSTNTSRRIRAELKRLREERRRSQEAWEQRVYGPGEPRLSRPTISCWQRCREGILSCCCCPCCDDDADEIVYNRP